MNTSNHTLIPEVSSLAELFEVQPQRDIIEWAQNSIDFTDDVSAERARLDLSLSPFLIEPLRVWDFSGKIREVSICGIEQHGKTLLEVIGILYNFVYNPCSNLCVYPSDEDASDINKTKYEPLIRKIPSLAAELARPFSSKKDRYIFGAATMFFQGAGKKIMSKACKIVVLDEEDHYPVVGMLDAGEDARKRGRSYSESMLYRVCTPTTAEGPIWRSFLSGSQGYWTLRCQNCGKLTMRSCDLHNLQFESVFDEARGIYTPVSDSIRLVCPVCFHEHTESDKSTMNQFGDYVHRFPERKELHPSFQFGALASQFPFMSWERIASKILECGKRADIKAHYELDNSYRGLPYSPRRISRDELENIKDHLYHNPPKPEEIEMVFAVSDTQDLFSPTGIFALDVHDNLFLLEYKNIDYLSLGVEERERLEMNTGNHIETVEEFVRKPRLGINPLFHVVDYRGHRQSEILRYADRNRNVIMYAGDTRKPIPWKPSSSHPRMMIVDAKAYQKVLLFQLYAQKNKETNFLYLPDTLEDETVKEITCVQPDNTRKSGHLYENWAPQGDAVHDAFDVLKMAYFGVEWAIQSLRRERFRIGKSQAILRRWQNSPVRKPAPAQVQHSSGWISSF